MRKVTRVFLLLALVLMSAPVFTQPGECVPGAVYRGRDGQMIDCLETLGTDCLACTFIFQG